MPNNSLALTIGDPTGIGPEIAVKAIQKMGLFKDTHFIIIGSRVALEQAASKLRFILPDNQQISYQAVEAISPGATAYRSIEIAVAIIANKQARALVTGPISKENLIAAGYGAVGHTEILEELAHRLFKAPEARAEMLFVYRQFRLMLLTRHIALQDVPSALSAPDAVSKPIMTLLNFLLHQAKITSPNIAILGVNPHSGEVGGNEEKNLFAPLIEKINQSKRAHISGPFAADAFFRGFNPQKPNYDAIVAAYHDQGLIPFKLLAGFDAVNVTIGLPFIRTSVSHGTAEDIVGKNIAKPDSFLAAISMAIQLSHNV